MRESRTEAVRRVFYVSLCILGTACDNRAAWHAPHPSLERMQSAEDEQEQVRPPPADSVPHDADALTSTPKDRAALARGRHHYTVFCAPCHGALGDGDAFVPTRMRTKPPSLLTTHARALGPEHLATVIRDGEGKMAAFNAVLSAEEIAEVVAYTQVLQLSQDVALNTLPEDIQKTARRNLEAP